MSINYTALYNVAKKLIEQNGQTATMTISTTSYNVNTSENTLTPTNTTISAVLLNYGTIISGDTIDPATMIQKGDRKILISSTVTPEQDGTITIGGVIYRIIRFKDINPAGTNIYYEVQGRNG